MFTKSLLVIGYIATLYIVGQKTGVIRDFSGTGQVPPTTSTNTQSTNVPSNVQHVYHHNVYPWYYDPWWDYPPYLLSHKTYRESESIGYESSPPSYEESQRHKSNDDDDEITIFTLIIVIFSLIFIAICFYLGYRSLYLFSPQLGIVVLLLNLAITIVFMFCIYPICKERRKNRRKKEEEKIQIILAMLTTTALSGIFAIFHPIFAIYLIGTLPIMIEQLLFV